MCADFQFFLNRQGPRGPQGYKGDKGDDGKTPVPRTGTNTPIETTVIFDTGDGNPYETPNLKYPIEDRGGNVVMLDRTNSIQYYGTPDQATDNSYGIVKLATPESVLVDPLDNDVVTYELFDNNNQSIKAVTDDLAGDITQLNTDLGAEVTNRTNADTQLTDKINTDISNEATARSNADIALSGRIDNLATSKADKSDVYTKTQTDSLLNNKSNVGHTHNYNDLTNKPTIPTVGNGTITLIQGGVTKGTFTTNQSGNSTIELDAGGSGGGGGNYTAGNGINITNDVISVKVDNDSIYVNQDGELVANIEDIEDALNAILGGDASIFDDYYTKIQSDSRYVQGSALSQVAISGSYNDLSNKPIIPSAQIQSDWGQTTTSALDYIKNKPTNLVVTDSAQTITGRKTFVGPAAIYFKQSTSTDTLGFTLYDSSNNELAGFQYRPQTINSTTNLLNINTKYANDTLLGFRYWAGSGSDPVVNVIAPKPLTGGDYYIPLNITDGTNTVTADSVGTVDISTLLSGGSTPSNMVTTDTQQIITGRKDMAIINIQPSGSTGYLNYITPMSNGRIAISKSTSYDTGGTNPGVLLEYTGGSSVTVVGYGGGGSYINLCTEYGNNTAEVRFCNGYKAGQVGSYHSSIGKYGNYTYIKNANANDQKVYKITGSPSSTSSYTNFFLESDMLDGTYLKWDSTTGKITVDIQAIKDAINAL